MPQFISCWTVLVILAVSGLPCQAISVTGILGNSVILPSCMPADSTPSKVTWSIFKNDTQIATLRPTSTKVDWWPEFEDRLLLNANNGSLQIKNLQRKDAMSYTLNMNYNITKPCTNFVNLRIIKPIPKPNITIEKTEQCGSCNFFVKCLVTIDSKVNYSLKLTDDSIGNENGSILKVRNIPFNTKRSFTCVASNSVTQSSTTVTEHCGNTEPIAKVEITIQKQRGGCNFILNCFVSNHSNFNYVWNNADDSSVSGSMLEVDIAFNTKRSFTCVASNSLTTSTATVTVHCGNTDLNVWRSIAIIAIIGIIIIIIGTIILFKSRKCIFIMYKLKEDNVSKRENESMRSDKQFIEDPMEFIEEERELRAFLNIEDEIKVVENSKSENSEQDNVSKRENESMRSDKQFIEDPMEFIEEERELRAFLNIEDEIKVVENSKSENSEQDNVSKRENESMRSDKQFIEDPMEFIEEERELRAFLNIEDEIKVVENSKSENSEQDNVSKRENDPFLSDKQP